MTPSAIGYIYFVDNLTDYNEYRYRSTEAVNMVVISREFEEIMPNKEHLNLGSTILMNFEHRTYDGINDIFNLMAKELIKANKDRKIENSRSDRMRLVR